MNIGFDAKRLFLNFTGLGNYSRFVLDTLLAHQPGYNFYLYTPKVKTKNETAHYFGKSNIEIVTPGRPFNWALMSSLWRSALVSNHFTVPGLDVFHGLSHELPVGMPKSVKKIVTIHDLIFLKYPKFYKRIDAWTYKKKVQSACDRADRIVAVSRSTAMDIAELLGISPGKIEVVYQGCHESFKKECGAEKRLQVKAKYALPGEYVLNVGTIEERKNVHSLVEALALLKKEERPKLVIVGRKTAYFNKVLATVQALRMEDEVLFLHEVEFADLPAIYQMAKVFVYTSLMEGFGIPIVEAVESCIPVIAPKSGCFSEAAGPYAKYVDIANAEELSHAIGEILVSDVRFQVKKQKDFVNQYAGSAPRLLNDIYSF